METDFTQNFPKRFTDTYGNATAYAYGQYRGTDTSK